MSRLSTPAVSVLVPTYNRQAELPRTLDSIAAQSFGDIEIVVVDNCSTDASWQIIRAYADKDPRFTVHRNRDNLGPVRNWMKALELSRADLVKVVYSDDWLEPTAVEELVAPLVADPDLGFAFGGVKIVGESRGTFRWLPEIEVGPVSTEEISTGIASGRLHYMISPVVSLFRRSLIKKAWMATSWAQELPPHCNALGAGFDLATTLVACELTDQAYFVGRILAGFAAGTENLSKVGGCRECWRIALRQWAKNAPLHPRWRRRVLSVLALRTLRETKSLSSVLDSPLGVAQLRSILAFRPPIGELKWFASSMAEGGLRRLRRKLPQGFQSEE